MPIVFGKCLDYDKELQAELVTIYEEQIMNKNTPHEETTSQRITRSKTKTNKDDIIQDNESTTYTSRRDQAEARARDRAWDRFLAYVYFSNSYAPKYGSLLKSLRSGYALKRNEFPTNIETAKSILDSHKWDPDWNSKSNRKNDKKQFSKGDDVKSQSRNGTERTQNVPQEVETMHRKDIFHQSAIRNRDQNRNGILIK
jgi:hypothetical protein